MPMLIVACPDLPSLVAMTFAIPGPTAVTTPVVETVATAGVFDDPAIARPVSGVLLASTVGARACGLLPTIIDVGASATFTLATATGVAPATVRVACAVRPSIVPMMFAVPALTADTRPVGPTLATVGSLELHIGARPVTSLPPSSYIVDVACVI